MQSTSPPARQIRQFNSSNYNSTTATAYHWSSPSSSMSLLSSFVDIEIMKRFQQRQVEHVASGVIHIRQG